MRPRIGQFVVLRSGARGEVLSVAKSVDALRAKSEAEIMILAPDMMATMGADWMDRYYEATVQLTNSTILVVTPRDVASAYDPE